MVSEPVAGVPAHRPVSHVENLPPMNVGGKETTTTVPDLNNPAYKLAQSTQGEPISSDIAEQPRAGQQQQGSDQDYIAQHGGYSQTGYGRQRGAYFGGPDQIVNRTGENRCQT